MTPRIAYLLAKRGRAVVVVLFVVAALAGGVAAWEYTHPPATTVTDHRNVQSVTVAGATSATVTGDTSLYRAGTTLRDEPVYLTRAAPTLNLTVTTSTSSSATLVEQRLAVVYTATRDGSVFWERRTPLATETVRDTRSASVARPLPIPEIRERLRAYQRTVGDAGTVTAAVDVSVTYSLAGYRGTLTGTYPLTVDETWYALETDRLTADHATPTERTRTLPAVRSPLLLGSLGVGGVAGLLGLVTAVLVRRRGAAASVDDARAALHRRRFDEWISEGSVPRRPDGSTVRMATLEDLVDVAIDSNKRVVSDRDDGRFVVVDGDTHYIYSP